MHHYWSIGEKLKLFEQSQILHLDDVLKVTLKNKTTLDLGQAMGYTSRTHQLKYGYFEVHITATVVRLDTIIKRRKWNKNHTFHSCKIFVNFQ